MIRTAPLVLAGFAAVALVLGASDARAEGLKCAMTCVEACDYGPETGQLLILDRNATGAAVSVVADEGLFPGDRMPERLSTPLGWEGAAVSPPFVETSFDGETGDTVIFAPSLRIGDASGALRIGPEGPAFAAKLDDMLARTLFRRKDVIVSYAGTCEVTS